MGAQPSRAAEIRDGELAVKNSIATLRFRELGGQVEALAATDEEFREVEKVFCAGTCRDAYSSYWSRVPTGTPGGRYRRPQVIAVHKVHNSKAKLDYFRELTRLVQQSRGDANVRRAWHGSSAEAVVSIVRYGFAQKTKPLNGNLLGSGLYLAPYEKPSIGRDYSLKDKNGQRHILLCQVILGKSEKIWGREGEGRCTPSSPDYDSAVDGARDPLIYMVWSPFINTHVVVLYIVTFEYLT